MGKREEGKKGRREEEDGKITSAKPLVLTRSMFLSTFPLSSASMTPGTCDSSMTSTVRVPPASTVSLPVREEKALEGERGGKRWHQVAWVGGSGRGWRPGTKDSQRFLHHEGAAIRDIQVTRNDHATVDGVWKDKRRRVESGSAGVQWMRCRMERGR